MQYTVIGLLIALGLFVVYRMYLGMEADKIVDDSGIRLDEQKRQEYEKQEESLDSEVRRDQAKYDAAVRADARKPTTQK